MSCLNSPELNSFALLIRNVILVQVNCEGIIPLSNIKHYEQLYKNNFHFKMTLIKSSHHFLKCNQFTSPNQLLVWHDMGFTSGQLRNRCWTTCCTVDWLCEQQRSVLARQAAHFPNSSSKPEHAGLSGRMQRPACLPLSSQAPAIILTLE